LALISKSAGLAMTGPDPAANSPLEFPFFNSVRDAGEIHVNT
jgi:hypothetical protein